MSQSNYSPLISNVRRSTSYANRGVVRGSYDRRSGEALDLRKAIHAEVLTAIHKVARERLEKSPDEFMTMCNLITDCNVYSQDPAQDLYHALEQVQYQVADLDVERMERITSDINDKYGRGAENSADIVLELKKRMDVLERCVKRYCNACCCAKEESQLSSYDANVHIATLLCSVLQLATNDLTRSRLTLTTAKKAPEEAKNALLKLDVKVKARLQECKRSSAMQSSPKSGKDSYEKQELDVTEWHNDEKAKILSELKTKLGPLDELKKRINRQCRFSSTLAVYYVSNYETYIRPNPEDERIFQRELTERADETFQSILNDFCTRFPKMMTAYFIMVEHGYELKRNRSHMENLTSESPLSDTNPPTDADFGCPRWVEEFFKLLSGMNISERHFKTQLSYLSTRMWNLLAYSDAISWKICCSMHYTNSSDFRIDFNGISQNKLGRHMADVEQKQYLSDRAANLEMPEKPTQPALCEQRSPSESDAVQVENEIDALLLSVPTLGLIE